MESDAYKSMVRELGVKIGKRRHVLASIDRFHPISGLKNKLLAY